MPEYIVSVNQSTPRDTEICMLTASLEDNGILIHAYSPILGAFIKKKRTQRVIGLDLGFEDLPNRNLHFFYIPTRMAMGFGDNSFRRDLFIPTRSEPMLGVDDPRPRLKNAYDPNPLWLYVDGLESGVEILFPQPAHVPADILEYLTRSMDKARSFYLRYVQGLRVTASLVERLDE